MTIAVYSRKGGVGKSSISINLAIILRYNLIDNDPEGGIVDKLNYGKKDKKGYTIDGSKEIPFMDNTVYDLRECKDGQTQRIIQKSDLVVIPTLHSFADIVSTIATIKYAQGLGQQNITVVINRVDTRTKKKKDNKIWYKDFEDTKRDIDQQIQKIGLNAVTYIKIRDNKAWLNSASKGKSIIRLSMDSKLVRHNSDSAIEDLEKLMKSIRG